MNRSPWVRAGALVIVVSTLLAAGLAFASAAFDDGKDRSLIGLSPATTTTLSAHQAALAALLPDGPLDGMVRSDEDLGPLSLETAAENYPYGDPDGARLKVYGFTQGFARAWAGADGRVAHVVVYEMRDPGAFLAAWQTVVADLVTSRFPTPVGEGISSVEGDEGSPDRSEASIVAWVEGSYWYYVVHFGPADGSGPDHLRTIVRAVQEP